VSPPVCQWRTRRLCNPGWRERGWLPRVWRGQGQEERRGGEPSMFSEARSQLVQWDISIQRAG